MLNTVSMKPICLEPFENFADTAMEHDDATINLLTTFQLMEDAADEPVSILANADLSVFNGGK